MLLTDAVLYSDGVLTLCEKCNKKKTTTSQRAELFFFAVITQTGEVRTGRDSAHKTIPCVYFNNKSLSYTFLIYFTHIPVVTWKSSHSTHSSSNTSLTLRTPPHSDIINHLFLKTFQCFMSFLPTHC